MAEGIGFGRYVLAVGAGQRVAVFEGRPELLCVGAVDRDLNSPCSPSLMSTAAGSSSSSSKPISSSAAASSSKPASTAPPANDDLEKLLNREATAFQREVEVERILKAFKLK